MLDRQQRGQARSFLATAPAQQWLRAPVLASTLASDARQVEVVPGVPIPASKRLHRCVLTPVPPKVIGQV